MFWSGTYLHFQSLKGKCMGQYHLLHRSGAEFQKNAIFE